MYNILSDLFVQQLTTNPNKVQTQKQSLQVTLLMNCIKTAYLALFKKCHKYPEIINKKYPHVGIFVHHSQLDTTRLTRLSVPCRST